jgi:cysteine-rich repeat protein
MKLNSMAWLGIAGLFTGFTALVTACGTSDNTTNGGGDGVCGNAIVEGEEQCDDGNSNDTDGCSNACTKGSASTTSGAGGSTAAGGSTCGNGKLDPGEECDDGNDSDTDSCKNNCTSNAPKTCGNGMVDTGEECDDGNKVAEDGCTNLCTLPKCGDGIIQAGEDCDDGINNENNGKCPKDCKNPPMTTASSSTVDPCMGKKTFHSVVSNNMNPSQMGNGISSKWSYQGLEGLEAGTAMCQAVGADHVCNYDEVVKAEAAGELTGALPTTLTYWLHRTTSIVNPVLNKACNNDNECQQAGMLPYCDPVSKMCAFKAGAGARCNDWTYPTGHISDGEYFRVAGVNPAMDNNGIKKGTLVYHIDGDSYYDGVTGDPHLCSSSNKVGCAGGCAGAGNRAILCCNPVCK